jgi:hypothetical protein
MNTVTQNVDQIGDLIEMFDQRIPTDLRVVLEFGNHSIAIKRGQQESVCQDCSAQ